MNDADNAVNTSAVEVCDELDNDCNGEVDDGLPVATYWHDHRGDDHGLEFANGTTDRWPVGRMTDFLAGGGPQPLRLTEAAVAYLTDKLEH